jgi:hypothetical protein
MGIKSKKKSRAVEIIAVDLPDFSDEQPEPLIDVLAEILAATDAHPKWKCDVWI